MPLRTGERMGKRRPYDLALAKIEKALRMGQTELSLADMDLTEIPEPIGVLSDLESLDISGNSITTLPDSIGNLERLTEFAAADSGIEFLPESIGRCVSLKSIVLWDRNRAGQLTHLPESLGGLSELELLDVQGHRLESLPSSIAKLSNLDTLDLDNNRLKTLPTELGFLENLGGLFVSGNPLEPELAAAAAEGTEAIKAYLRSKSNAQVVLNEAKLIVVGEGGGAARGCVGRREADHPRDRDQARAGARSRQRPKDDAERLGLRRAACLPADASDVLQRPGCVSRGMEAT
jgi:hypothetical protein